MPPPFISPLPGRTPRGSGWWFGAPRSGGRLHEGLDFLAPQGTPLTPLAAGKVTQAGQGTTAAGWAVTLAHAGRWSSFYCHLSEISVARGDLIDLGDPFALSGGRPGSTGAGNSAAPHLHLGVRLDGRAIDPLPLLAWPEHRGADALWLQGRLEAHGFDPGPLDGIAGPRTLVALGDFQRARKLPVTFLLDSRNRNRLTKAPRR